MPTRGRPLLLLAVSLVLAGCVDAAPTPTPTTAIPVRTPAAGTPVEVITAGMRVESWERPQPGWLLVLDTAGQGERSQVLLVDPVARAIKGRISAGFSPHLALSRDGTTIYPGTHNPPELVAIDAATGLARWMTPLALVQGKVPSRYGHMEVSGDGRYLFATSYDSSGGPWLTVLDARDGRWVTAGENRTPCELSSLIGAHRGPGVLAHCRETVVRHRLDETTQALLTDVLADIQQFHQPDVHTRSSIATWTAPRADGSVYLATSDGRLVSLRVDGVPAAVVQTVDLHLDPGTIVPFAPAALSPDGSRLYLPLQRFYVCPSCHGRLSGEVIEVIDTATAARNATIRPSTLVSTLALSPEGATLYIADIDAGALVLVDTRTLAELATIDLNAVAPAQLLVFPGPVPDRWTPARRGRARGRDALNA